MWNVILQKILSVTLTKANRDQTEMQSKASWTMINSDSTRKDNHYQGLLQLSGGPVPPSHVQILKTLKSCPDFEDPKLLHTQHNLGKNVHDVSNENMKVQEKMFKNMKRLGKMAQ